MEKIFGGKKITIREFKKSDLKIANKFVDFFNSLVKEDVMIGTNKKITLKEELEYLRNSVGRATHKVSLLAECDGKIVGMTGIDQLTKRSTHIGQLGIMIRDGYRGVGLGKFLMKEIIVLAKKKIKPKLKMIRLFVYVNNEPAIKLYKKMGFKKIAKLPRHIQYRGKLIDEFVMIKEL